MSEDRGPIKTVYRSRTKGDGFTVFDNKMIQNQNMLYATRGLLCYLLSHPATWLIELDRLIRPGNEGRKTITKLIKEAISHGYMGDFKVRNAQGRFEKHIYWVTDDPENPPIEPESEAQKELELKPLCPLGIVEETKPQSRTGIVDETALKDDETGQLLDENTKNPQCPTGGVESLQVTTIPNGQSGDFILSKNNKNNNYYNNIYKNTQARVEGHAAAIAAIEAFGAVQQKSGFQKIYDMSPQRVEALAGAIAAVGGLEAWQELLERATHSDYCRGRTTEKFYLSIDGMSSLRVLEKISQTPLKFGPQDRRWAEWYEYARQHDQSLARLMVKVEAGELATATWSFPTSRPPIQMLAEQLNSGNGAA